MRKLITLLFVVTLTFSAGCGSKSDSSNSSTTTLPENELSKAELGLQSKLPLSQQDCLPVRKDKEKIWKIATATITCRSANVTHLSYGLFESAIDLNDTFVQQETEFIQSVTETGASVETTPTGKMPCSVSPNERGEWQGENGFGGKYICVSEPYPRIGWTENKSKVIGYAELRSGTVAELGEWWTTKAGPK